MSTYREVVYMVLDKLKLAGDDSYFTEEHVIFMLDKARAFLLKKYYETQNKELPESVYQTICIDLMPHGLIQEIACETGTWLRSTKKLPNLINVGKRSLYPENFFVREIEFVKKERMRYVGNNRYMQSILYATIDPEHYLWLKSANPQFLYLKRVKLNAVFENPKDADEMSCDGAECDVLDMEFPMEEAFIETIIEQVSQELYNPTFMPEDEVNNSKDDRGDSPVPKQQPQKKVATDTDNTEQQQS